MPTSTDNPQFRYRRNPFLINAAKLPLFPEKEEDFNKNPPRSELCATGRKYKEVLNLT